MQNKVFIATSLDGYIADKNGGIDWLHAIPNPEQDDMGYANFIAGIDAIAMGRNTFEIVNGFDIDWPYTKKVFVLSNTLSEPPAALAGKVEMIKGQPKEVVQKINEQGYDNLYIDGGRVIQNFLQEDLIDEMTITTIPILLGGGIPLFGALDQQLAFTCVESKTYLGKIAQNRFLRFEREKK